MATRINAETMAEVTQLGYVGFGVSNIEAWKEFATEVLGVQINGSTEDGSVFLRMDNYHHRFEIIPGGNDDLAYHGWEVKDAAALEQIASQVRAYGIEVTAGTQAEADKRMVIELIKFNDPEGFPTEIYYGARIDHTPFVSPLGVKGFNADSMGLGHILLVVSDGPRYLKFYTEVLGAKISDFIVMTRGDMKMKLNFLHVNPRHHSLAFMQRPPGAPVGKRIGHFMMEVKTLDDVGQARARFEHRGIATGNLGRHTNDHMFSFYAETPSGFQIEYGYDGVQIHDEDKWEVGHHTAASIWGHGMPQRAAPAAAPEKAKTPA